MTFSSISFEIIILEPIKYFINCQFQIFFSFIVVWSTFVRSGIIRGVCNIRTNINKKQITYIYVTKYIYQLYSTKYIYQVLSLKEHRTKHLICFCFKFRISFLNLNFYTHSQNSETHFLAVQYKS